ncbi:O-antigen ligase family protein [Patescibacteria group bacterium]|nr:O-antigen ligase family protein [Patescibacteria group bacterium]
MGRTKALALGEKLIFILLVLFPFGQLIRLVFNIFGQSVVLQPIDLIAGFVLLLVLFSKTDKPRTIAFRAFFVSLLYSFAFSIVFFKVSRLLPGTLYFLRLVAYYFLFILAWNLSKNKKGFKELVLKALLLEAVVVGIFGWYQYFRYPDLTSLKFLGWDDHLYRLVSTFLDPGFTGIILALGFLIALVKFFQEKKKIFLIALAFLLITTAFTYARAAYLALLAGSVVVLFLKKKIKIFALILAGLVLIAVSLPRPSSEGVKLERVSSIYPRLKNYSESFEIIKKSPLFGVGYNNLCEAKIKYLGQVGQDSHSCTGLDSSVLMIWATTGIFGLIIFSYLIFVVWTRSSADIYGLFFKSSIVAVFVHSLFTNSLFYPWVLGWMALILGASFRENS